jgi:uncharacterized membrane protein
MNSIYWIHLHGGVTHFPIAFVFGAALFETLGFIFRSKQREFGTIGSWLLLLAGLSGFGAMFSGLATSKWNPCGKGLLLQHHLFAWPSFALIVALATWRLAVGANPSRAAFLVYLSIMVVACALVSGAGFSGSNVLLGR